MKDSTKKFCVMTVGRSGSTALMNYLKKFDDIALPCKDIVCVDNELLHPAFIKQYQAQYAAISGQPITNNDALMHVFFDIHRKENFAGFKSMPDRHQNIRQFLTDPNMQIIALWREDVASTVASFMKAQETGCWRRDGASETDKQWRFVLNKHGEAAFRNLAYVLRCNAILKNAPHAIRFNYESLCNANFNHPQLDDFFERNVKIDNPKPPTSAEQYVENWSEFKQFITDSTQKIITISQQTHLQRGNSRPIVKNTTKSNHNQINEVSSFLPDLTEVLSYLEHLNVIAQQRKAEFNGIESLCFFIGYPYSGQSIIGAILDAHPEICIAHDLNINRCIRAGLQRDSIYHLITENSRLFSEQWSPSNSYTYQVAGQSQGKTQCLKVIGNKKVIDLNRSMTKNPSTLEMLHSTFNIPIKFIHITRNPYDNVATLAAKNNLNLDQAAELYFTMIKATSELKTQLKKTDICEISHEDFIANPKIVLRTLLNFLNLSSSPEYLEACAAIVRKKPDQSRHQADWTEFQKNKMANTIRQFSFLEHYQFTSE